MHDSGHINKNKHTHIKQTFIHLFKERQFHEKALSLIHRKHSDFTNLFFFNLGQKVGLDLLN